MISPVAAMPSLVTPTPVEVEAGAADTHEQHVGEHATTCQIGTCAQGTSDASCLGGTAATDASWAMMILVDPR